MAWRFAEGDGSRAALQEARTPSRERSRVRARNVGSRFRSIPPSLPEAAADTTDVSPPRCRCPRCKHAGPRRSSKEGRFDAEGSAVRAMRTR